MSETQQSRKNSQPVRVALASLIGTAIEQYDFLLYTTSAALVFGPLFFSPRLSPLAAQLSAFATLWVGFAARPVGGVVFGHFGDRLGRKTMLVLTLLIMGVATSPKGQAWVPAAMLGAPTRSMMTVVVSQ